MFTLTVSTKINIQFPSYSRNTINEQISDVIIQYTFNDWFFTYIFQAKHCKVSIVVISAKTVSREMCLTKLGPS